MEDKQYFMAECSFEPEVRLGCISIKNADQLPLSDANLIYRAGNVSLALASSDEAVSFVSINTFCFPHGLAEFERLCDWYGQDRKSRAKLPEGIKFEESILSIPDVPIDWSHEGLASPILCDVAKHSMLDFIPFTGARRQMAYNQLQANLIGQVLQCHLPQSRLRNWTCPPVPVSFAPRCPRVVSFQAPIDNTPARCAHLRCASPLRQPSRPARAALRPVLRM